MIFATVGTQLPFDRLLVGLDRWAAANPGIPVLAQAGASQRRFRHIETVGQLSLTEFRAVSRPPASSWRMPGWARSCRPRNWANP
jgi:hypothetical protein